MRAVTHFLHPTWISAAVKKDIPAGSRLVIQLGLYLTNIFVHSLVRVRVYFSIGVKQVVIANIGMLAFLPSRIAASLHKYVKTHVQRRDQITGLKRLPQFVQREPSLSWPNVIVIRHHWDVINPTDLDSMTSIGFIFWNNESMQKSL